MFSDEFCVMHKTPFFTEHLQATASVLRENIPKPSYSLAIQKFLFSASNDTLKARASRNTATPLRIDLLLKIISHTRSFDLDFSKY